MIEIKNLRKSFGKQLVLDGINLEIADGETIAIVGPSGTGKSVLLKIITGLLVADSGEVIVNGKSVTACRGERERRRICSTMGILFQSAALFDSLTVYENVAFPLNYRKSLSKKELHKKVVEKLEEVQMLEHANSLPGEISIGMRKRAGIARALVTEPDIILFDEPNTGLDPEMGQDIYELIVQMQKIRQFTGIVISHEIPEVFQVCERVAMLYSGKVQFDNNVEQFMSSNDSVVRQFVRGDTEGPIQISA